MKSKLGGSQLDYIYFAGFITIPGLHGLSAQICAHAKQVHMLSVTSSVSFVPYFVTTGAL